ncbi:MAG: adenosylcobinamide-GDP ribazoletransferase [Candidatus Zipacnadales bacterium]
MASLWLAIRLLTCVPVPQSVPVTPGNLAASMRWWPIVGATLGAFLGLTELLIRKVTNSHALSCSGVVALGIVLTRGIPLRALIIMTGALFSARDFKGLAKLVTSSTPTSFGVLAGIGALLLRYTLLLALPASQRFGVLFLAAGLGRAAIVWVCWRFRYAHIDTGIGSWLAAAAGPQDLMLVLPVIAIGFALLGPLYAGAMLGGAWLSAHGFGMGVSRALAGLTSQAYEAIAEVGELGGMAAIVGMVFILHLL